MTESSSMCLPTLWVVTDQLPFPPRNGITLPVFNYIEGLRNSNNIQLVLLFDTGAPPHKIDLAANEARFGHIIQIPYWRKNKLIRLFAEITGRELYQHGWRRLPEININEFGAPGAFIVSPMSAVAKWNSLKIKYNQTPVSIAAVNDCTAAEYYFRGKQSFGGFKLFLKAVIDRLRSKTIGRVEKKLLTNFDHILLQTKVDAELMNRLVGNSISKKIVLVPNGVRPEFLSINPNSKSTQVAFVAELSGEYGPIASWLVSEVWPRVLREAPALNLKMVGKGADSRLQAIIRGSNRVSYISFIDDIADLYKDSLVVLSPIFKGYGLINKTLEAMASGLPVVGGVAAFNGIIGFEKGRDGIVCETNTADSFARAIVELAKDPELCMRIGDSGRALVRNQFRWELAVKKIDDLLTIDCINERRI